MARALVWFRLLLLGWENSEATTAEGEAELNALNIALTFGGERSTEILRELRRLRNSRAVLGDIDRLYSVTGAMEGAMAAAYESGGNASAACVGEGSTCAPAPAQDGVSSDNRRPGNFHGVKDHAYYVGAISEAHPSLPFEAVQSIVASEWYHPGLTAKSVWCVEDCGNTFPLAARLDAEYEAIRREAAAFWQHPDATARLKGVGAHTTQFDKLIAGNGTWVDVRLWRGRAFDRELCERHFRVTCSVVERSPEIWTNPWSHVLLSILLPDSWVPFHQGHTNGQLTYHLPLELPSEAAGTAELALLERGGSLADEDSRGQVLSHASERVVHWRRGRTLVFDDSFSHAVRFRQGDRPPPETAPTHALPEAGGLNARVVLLMRGWHPELEASERDALREFVRRGGEEEPDGYDMLPSPSLATFSL